MNVTNHTNRGNVTSTGWSTGILSTAVLGAAGNAVLLLAAVKYAPLRSLSSRPLIIHCIALSIVMGVVVIPMSNAPMYLDRDYPLHSSYCWFYEVIGLGLIVVSNWADCMLAAHRLAAAVQPTIYDFLTKKKIMLVMLGFPWLMATAVIGYLMAERSQLHSVRELNTGTCVMKGFGKRGPIVGLFFAAVGMYSPIAMAGLSHFVVLLTAALRYRKRRTSLMVQRGLDIAVTLTAGYLWHSVGWYAITIVQAVSPEKYQQNPDIQGGLRWLSVSSFAVSPVRARKIRRSTVV